MHAARQPHPRQDEDRNQRDDNSENEHYPDHGTPHPGCLCTCAQTVQPSLPPLLWDNPRRNVRIEQPFRHVLAVIVVASVSSGVPAASGQTRAEELARQQAEKSKRLKPNEPGVVERALNRFEENFNDPDTTYFTFGGLYPSAGFAPGFAYRNAFGHARLDLGVAYSVKAYKLAHASLRFPSLAANRLELETHVRWTDATQVPFYGLGMQTRRDGRTNYGLTRLDAGGSAVFKPVRWYRIGAGLASERIEDSEGAGSRPSIETYHTPVTAPGLRSDARYIHTRAFTAIDWRESAGYTRRGGLYSLAFNDFRDPDDRLGFQRVDAELRQYVPVLKEHWVLAVRALLQTTTSDDGQVVPYHLLPSLGGARTHRGYTDFRFQDRHLLLLSGEYRWLPSRVLDMAIFVDAGKVTADRRDLDFNHLETAYGIGARIHGPTVTPLRIDVARGSEGIRLHITGGLTF